MRPLLTILLLVILAANCGEPVKFAGHSHHRHWKYRSKAEKGLSG